MFSLFQVVRVAKDKDLVTFQQVYSHIEAYKQEKKGQNLNYRVPQRLMQLSHNTRSCNPVEVLGTIQNGCGGPHHGGFKQRERDCPGWGKKCFGCGKMNHLVHCCKTSNGDSGSKPGGVNAAASAGDGFPSSSALAALGGADNVSYFFAFDKELKGHSCSDDTARVPHIEWDGAKFSKASPPP